MIAEQLVGGREIAPEGYVQDGRFHAHGVIDMVRGPNHKSFQRYEYPSRASERLQQHAIDAAERVLAQIGFDDGCFNMEFFRDEDEDRLWVIEINPRISQSHSKLFEKVDGMSNHEVAVHVALGDRPKFEHGSGPFRHAAKFGALVFQSAPLDEPVEILGAPVAELALAVDRPVAQVAVRLCDVLPDGRVTRVTYGILNLTHRDSHESPAPCEPGRLYRVTVPLNHIAQVFPKGHRIRLSLSTSYWPLVWPPPEPVCMKVFPAESALLLPVRSPQPDDDDLRPLGPPEGAPRVSARQLEPENHNWVVVRDLAEDLSVLEVTDDTGAWRIEETGTEIRRATWEWYRSRADAFDSVEGETHTVRGFRRGDWETRATTRTVLRSTPTHFHLTAELDAWEGERRIFSQGWQRTIERDLL